MMIFPLYFIVPIMGADIRLLVNCVHELIVDEQLLWELNGHCSY